MAEKRPAEQVEKSDIAFFWTQSPLFFLFDEDDWRAFVARTSQCEISAGESLWREGEIGDRLFCVCSGRLEAARKTPEWGKPIIMAEFVAGATVGWVPNGDPTPHSTTLQVVETALLLEFDQAGLEDLNLSQPEVVMKLWRGAARLEGNRLRRANQRLVTLF